MQQPSTKLWAYNKALAFAAIPAVWIFFVVLSMLGKKYAGWQNILQGPVVLIVAVISFVPVLLLLLDFFSDKKAMIDIKGVKIDFSKINLDVPGVKRESFGLPDNIGISGPVISDTSPMDIVETLERAVNHEVVVLNLKSGEAWWVTRLLALCAGGVRTGSPSILVFIGKKENVINTYLGWGKPKDLLAAILADSNKEYKKRYEKAVRIARQVLVFKDSPLKHLLSTAPPTVSQGGVSAFDISRYSNDPRYTGLGEEITEQIIMDQMGNEVAYQPAGSLEKEPDKLTLSRLEELFGTCIYRNAIDLDSAKEQQVEKLLKTKAPYIALLRNGQYDSILKQSDGERLILRELFSQAKQAGNS